MSNYHHDCAQHIAGQIAELALQVQNACDAGEENVEDARMIAVLASDLQLVIIGAGCPASCDDCMRSGTCPIEGQAPCPAFIPGGANGR